MFRQHAKLPFDIIYRTSRTEPGLDIILTCENSKLLYKWMEKALELVQANTNY